MPHPTPCFTTRLINSIPYVNTARLPLVWTFLPRRHESHHASVPGSIFPLPSLQLHALWPELVRQRIPSVRDAHPQRAHNFVKQTSPDDDKNHNFSAFQGGRWLCLAGLATSTRFASFGLYNMPPSFASRTCPAVSNIEQKTYETPLRRSSLPSQFDPFPNQPRV